MSATIFTLAATDLKLVSTVAAAFAAAWCCGIATHKLRLSPIVGYLAGGVLVGTHGPFNFLADASLAQQLAELGVALLLFGVGLHFNLSDLLRVRGVVVPGAIGASAVATLLGLGLALMLGWSLASGLMLGFALSITSTVVVVRGMTDNRLLDSVHGHVAIGWLIVEDILSVLALVLIPALARTNLTASEPTASPWAAIPLALAKLAIFVVLMLVAGRRVIPWIMVKMARLRSRELFTLTVLVMGIAVATGSYLLFGASIALGAFLAGVMVGQSPVSHEAAANALPLRDAFAVLFFASVGMLFDPMFVVRHPLLLAGGLAVVMLGKPLTAMLITMLRGYPARTAVVVLLAMTHIGEFSFILADSGKAAGLLDESAHHLLVATSLVSISLNPLLLRQVNRTEGLLRRAPAVWRYMNRNARAVEATLNEEAGKSLESTDTSVAVIVGYGPVGRTVDDLLRRGGLSTVVVDLNLDTVQNIQKQGRLALYGDAFNIEVMHQALARATHLVIALPHHASDRNALIAAAKLINPDMKIFVRARYLAEREELRQVGADAVVYEEAEAAIGLARLALADRGLDDASITSEARRIRQDFLATLPAM